MTTIRDVAKYAGVSPITVSRVVNEAENVNPETRARVSRAIADLGYIPNLAARSLRSKQTFTLALILPDITSVFWTTVARGVEDAAQGGGYSVLLCNTDENPDKFTRYLNTVLRQRVDGVLVAPYSMDARQLSQLVEMKIPTVVIDRRVINWDGDSVYCDSVAGAQALTQHLLSLGHQRIAILSGPTATSTAEDRVAGYCLALRKADIFVDERLILRGEYRESSGILLTRELLSSNLAVTAIIAANNSIAAGVLEELKLQGCNVPGEIAVVCFDEMPEMERRFPFLTNVTQPAYDMGANASQLLLSRIRASGNLRPREVILPTRLILRYSCGRFLSAGEPMSTVKYSLISDLTESQLVMPLDDTDLELLLTFAPNLSSSSRQDDFEHGLAKPDKERLVRALAFQKSDRLPVLDNRGAGMVVMTYVLGRAVRLASDGLNILPEDAVEFAQKMGLDAIPCEISWAVGPIETDPADDLLARVRQGYPAPSLAVQLSAVENLLTAVEGTGVGVYVRFSSFVQNALRMVSETDLRTALQRYPELENLMDLIVKHQCRIMRALCDRFSRDLLFVSIQDDVLASSDMVADADLFDHSILPRLALMINPAKEHGLPVALDSLAPCGQALPGLFEVGVNIIQSAGLDFNPLQEFSPELFGRMVFIGGISSTLMARASKEEIEESIRLVCAAFLQKPGFILGPSTSFSDLPDIQPQNFASLMRAVQRYGLYQA
jgi:LacI family transcriptional regulator